MRAAMQNAPERTESAFDVEQVRSDFPILTWQVHGKPLVYLDSAATTQKPQAVIDVITQYYQSLNAPVHRSIHTLGEQATAAYEASRSKARRFLNAASEREIVFVRGTTEAINLVAHSFGRAEIHPGDEIIVSVMEHHSNIVPWQRLCEEKQATLRVIPITAQGELILEEYERLLNPRTRLVAVSHVSNALGTINPVAAIIEKAHSLGVPVLIDGAQAAPHLPLDVQALDCDFYAFSGHKLFGPTGIGILYGKEEWLDRLPPYQSGGEMIESVSFNRTTYNTLPHKFEAGTPDIAGAIGLGAALDYLQRIPLALAREHEQSLLDYATQALSEIDGLRIIGTAAQKCGVLSFVIDGIHPHDIGTILDDSGIAIRAGHHCAQPLMKRLGLPATARASFAIYNTKADVDCLARALQRVKEMFV
jgi:cysteine desulfurase / selenocysteine lyase